MAIFGASKEMRTAAENQVMQILASKDYLSMLMEELLVQSGKKTVIIDEKEVSNTENLWVLNCQGYYDTRRRQVVIEPDAFIIKWSEERTEKSQGADGRTQYQNVEDVHKQIGYAYTKDGYKPLHGVNVGNIAINTEKVVELWAKVIRERMMSLFPEIEYFGDISSNGETSSFTYYVQELQWKDWF